MSDYRPNEIVDMILMLGESGGNYRAAARSYQERYPDRRHPTHVVLRNCYLRARQGHLTRSRIRRGTSEAVRLTILAAAAVNPHISVREISRIHGIPRSTVSRALRTSRFLPYRNSLIHELIATDFALRLTFCRWAEERIRQDRHFFSYVMFSDEATFTNRGGLNHNCHYWAVENPHWYREIPHQHPWSVNVWCGIVNGYIVGPYFFDGTLTGAKYNDFLRNELPQLLEDVDLATRQRLWLQQDGAPPHYARIVRNTLQQMFSDHWIDRGGPVSWPPRSPDLTPIDFFLWGYVKGVVFQEQPTTPDDMKRRIRMACAAIPVAILTQVERSFRERLRLCIRVQGHQFEHYR